MRLRASSPAAARRSIRGRTPRGIWRDKERLLRK